jgi:hypothetical protein
VLSSLKPGLCLCVLSLGQVWADETCETLPDTTSDAQLGQSAERLMAERQFEDAAECVDRMRAPPVDLCIAIARSSDDIFGVGGRVLETCRSRARSPEQLAALWLASGQLGGSTDHLLRSLAVQPSETGLDALRRSTPEQIGKGHFDTREDATRGWTETKAVANGASQHHEVYEEVEWIVPDPRGGVVHFAKPRNSSITELKSWSWWGTLLVVRVAEGDSATHGGWKQTTLLILRPGPDKTELLAQLSFEHSTFGRTSCKRVQQINSMQIAGDSLVVRKVPAGKNHCGEAFPAAKVPRAWFELIGTQTSAP